MTQDLVKEYFPNFLDTYLSYDVGIKRHDAIRIVILYVYGGVNLYHDLLL